MTATLLNGNETRNALFEDLKARVAALPGSVGLATVLVGDDPGSHSYVKGKHRACEKVGIKSIRRDLPESITQEELEAVIDELNANPGGAGPMTVAMLLTNTVEAAERAHAAV